MPFTDLALRNAKPKDKPCKVFDGGGLHVRVRRMAAPSIQQPLIMPAREFNRLARSLTKYMLVEGGER